MYFEVELIETVASAILRYTLRSFIEITASIGRPGWLNCVWKSPQHFSKYVLIFFYWYVNIRNCELHTKILYDFHDNFMYWSELAPRTVTCLNQ